MGINSNFEGKRKAVLLVNVGTPDAAEVKSVRRFLSAFLNDPYVIDLPWLLRKILVNLIIIPFRAKSSTQLYQQLWEKEGSPLLSNSMKLRDKLALKMGEEYHIFLAMRYGNPSLKKALIEIQKENFDELILIPLFPQYASSTTETVYQKVIQETKLFSTFPKIKFVDQFYREPEFIEAWWARAQSYDFNNYDQILFSYHGLPLSHIQKSHPEHDLKTCGCEHKMPEYGQHCYKAATYETTRLLVEKFKLKEGEYVHSFQSRLSKKWLRPFTDESLLQLAREGNKKVLIFAPAFVADCLETKVEIGAEYAELFKKAGGKQLDLVESLNDTEAWVQALGKIIERASLR
jgi:ferrochelatase